ncbi:hypothetical protein NEIG_00809 [Nematocida sp. ERTm5]|nr:hypothetical protein NEIG_00809 [Nematocida sp. ERTm5]
MTSSIELNKIKIFPNKLSGVRKAIYASNILACINVVLFTYLGINQGMSYIKAGYGAGNINIYIALTIAMIIGIVGEYTVAREQVKKNIYYIENPFNIFVWDNSGFFEIIMGVMSTSLATVLIYALYNQKAFLLSASGLCIIMATATCMYNAYLYHMIRKNFVHQYNYVLSIYLNNLLLLGGVSLLFFSISFLFNVLLFTNGILHVTISSN